MGLTFDATVTGTLNRGRRQRHAHQPQPTR